ncbi:MAG: hypothetical protein ACPGYV_05475 [Phycisphaeraceae bacterium]
MPNDTHNTNADRSPSLLSLVERDGSEGIGSVMLRLAQMAAAQHRANAEPRRVEPWRDQQQIQLTKMDTPGQGRPALTRSARNGEPVTTEGDR